MTLHLRTISAVACSSRSTGSVHALTCLLFPKMFPRERNSHKSLTTHCCTCASDIFQTVCCSTIMEQTTSRSWRLNSHEVQTKHFWTPHIVGSRHCFRRRSWSFLRTYKFWTHSCLDTPQRTNHGFQDLNNIFWPPWSNPDLFEHFFARLFLFKILGRGRPWIFAPEKFFQTQFFFVVAFLWRRTEVLLMVA